MRLRTGVYGHRKRVCTESWHWESNPLPQRGIEPALATCRSDALTNWAASPPQSLVTLLSCIHTVLWLCYPISRSVNSCVHIHDPFKRTVLKQVLNTTSRCIHEGSISFRGTSRTSFIRPKTLRQNVQASQFSACKAMIRNTLWCYLLPLIGWFGLPRDADVTSLSQRANWPWRRHWQMQHAIFISPCASIFRCRAWV